MNISPKNLSFLFIITYCFVIQQSISLSAPTDVNGNTVHDPYSWADAACSAEGAQLENGPYGPAQVYPVEGTSLGHVPSWVDIACPAEGYNLGNVSYWPEQTYQEEEFVPGHVSYWSEQGDQLDEGDRESGGTNSADATNFFGTNSLSACELNSASLPSSEMGLSSEPGVLNVSEEPGALNVANIVGNFSEQRVSYTPLLSSEVDIDLPVEAVGSVVPTKHAVEVAKDSFELAKNFEAKPAAVTVTQESSRENRIAMPDNEAWEDDSGRVNVLVRPELRILPGILKSKPKPNAKLGAVAKDKKLLSGKPPATTSSNRVTHNEPCSVSVKIKEEEQWYKQGKKGAVPDPSVDSTKLKYEDSCLLKPETSKQATKHKQPVQNSKRGVRKVSVMDTVSTPRAARTQADKKTAGQSNSSRTTTRSNGNKNTGAKKHSANFNPMDDNNFDKTLAEARKKASSNTAAPDHQSKPKERACSSGNGLMYRKPQAGEEARFRPDKTSIAYLEARDIPCCVDTHLLAYRKGFVFDPDDPRHLAAARILYGNVWIALRGSGEHLILASAQNSNSTELDRAKISALAAHCCYFHPLNLALDTALAAILDLSVKICVVEKLCNLEVPDDRFVQIFKKYYDATYVDHAQDFAVFLKIMMNVGILYNASPCLSSANLECNNRIKASFFMATRAVFTCLDGDKPQCQCIFDLLLGELLDSVVGSLALLSFFGATTTIEQKLSGEDIDLCCETSSTRVLYLYILNSNYGVYNLGLLLSQIEQVSRNMEQRGYGSFLKASYCRDLGLFELAEKVTILPLPLVDPVETLSPNKNEFCRAVVMLGSFMDFVHKFFIGRSNGTLGSLFHFTAQGHCRAQDLELSLFGFKE